MALHVALVPDRLRGGRSLRPRIVQTETVDMNAILRYMTLNTALEEADMRATISRFTEALMFYLTQGENVVTPLGTFGLSARGTYREGEMPRVESRNLRIKFRPAARWLGAVRKNAKIVMEAVPARQLPAIGNVTNAEAAGVTNEGTAGQIIHLQGDRLCVDPADKELGVFLVAPDGTAHRMTVYSRTGSSRIDFKLAETPVGTYRLEVRTRPTRRDVWVGMSPEAFTVTA